MKRLLHLGSANLVAALLATPAPAKRAQSNKGGATKGLERAEQVQTTNKADAHRDFTVAPGLEKAEGKHASKKTHR